MALVATWTGRRWSAVANVVVGGLLMGWIVVQVGFIGLTSWLQPVMFVWGGAILVLGRHSKGVAPGDGPSTCGFSTQNARKVGKQAP